MLKKIKVDKIIEQCCHLFEYLEHEQKIELNMFMLTIIIALIFFEDKITDIKKRLLKDFAIKF